MIGNRIPYETLVQDALRNVVRQVLERVAVDGLPGEHHFYITFHTNIAGVEMSQRLKERYPDHVTIVLQNQFWDLEVMEEYFAVTLSFSDVPERLVVPFMAVQAFYDPVAAFEASFDIVAQIPPSSQETFSSHEVSVFAPKNLPPEASVPVSIAIKKQGIEEQKPKLDRVLHQAPVADEKQTAQVVSLDAFRKK